MVQFAKILQFLRYALLPIIFLTKFILPTRLPIETKLLSNNKQLIWGMSGVVKQQFEGGNFDDAAREADEPFLLHAV